MAYESPIEMIYDDIKTSYENSVVKAVQAYDIKVDKAELLKALKYDRAQYDKGFADGYAKGTAGAAAEAEAIPLEWIERQKAGCIYGSISYIALEALLKTWREERNDPEAEP